MAKDPVGITVVLTQYKRDYLAEQIKAIRNQIGNFDIKIWIWVNYADPDDEVPGPGLLNYTDYALGLEFDALSINDRNFKYLGRFAFAHLAQTEFVAIFDDDTIPGPRWFENCLNFFEQRKDIDEAILGGVGVQLKDANYVNHERYGWPTPGIANYLKADLVGHAWFFKKKTLRFMWMEEPFSYDNGEDIHFSYVAQKYGNVITVVPPQQNMETTSSLKAWEYGNDNKASSNGSLMTIPEFYKQRDECVQHAIRNGWKIINRKNI